MPSASPQKERKLKSSKKNKPEKKRKRHDSPPIPATKKVRTASTPASAAPKAPKAPNSPYSVKTTSFFFPLPPKYSFQPEKTYSQLLAAASSEQSQHLRSLSPKIGITKHHLDPLLMRYNDSVDGVVLGYDNIRFETPTARIAAESPFAYVWTTVDLLVWRPKTGMVLPGYVNLQSASHIGCLVDNTWNVSVPRERIPEEWVYEEENGEWRTKEGVSVEGKVGFVVESVKAGGSIFLLEGSMLDREKIEAVVSAEKEKTVEVEVR